MFLSVSVKALVTVVTIGSGGLATYYFTVGSGSNNSAVKTFKAPSSTSLPCSKPFVMKTLSGITMWVDTEREGRDFLQQYYKNEGTIEPCTNPIESK